jgi:HpcH/HpaI aldolase/citrate lyase family
VLVDCEHGNIADNEMYLAVGAIAAAGASPIVRIPASEAWMMKRALDAGAHGIMIPMCETKVRLKSFFSFRALREKVCQNYTGASRSHRQWYEVSIEGMAEWYSRCGSYVRSSILPAKWPGLFKARERQHCSYCSD